MKTRKKEKGPAQLYLERIKKLDVQIDAMEQEKQALRDLAYRVTPSMSGSGGASGGGNHDKIGSAAARIADKEAEIEEAIDRLIDMKDEATGLLKHLAKPEHFKVLHSRYILYKSFESIAVEMGYSYRNIHYLHGRALQAFEKVLEEYRIKRLSMTLEERIKERIKTPLE